MDKYTLRDMVRDVYSFIRPYRKKFWLGVFFRASSDLANLFPAYAFSTLVTMLTSAELLATPDKLWQQAVSLVVMWIVIIYYFQIGHDLSKYLGGQVAAYAGLDAQNTALKHMYQLDLSWHELENSGNKIKRIDNGNTAVKRTIDGFFTNIIESLINTIGIGVIFWTVDRRIAAILAVYMIIYFFLSHRLSLLVSKAYKPISMEEENYEGLSFESINNIRTLKSLLLYSPITRKIVLSLNKLKIVIRKFVWVSRLRSHILDVFTRLVEFTILLIIIFQITQKIEAIGLLILFRSLFWKVIEAVAEFSEVYNTLMIDKVYISRLRALLDEKPSIEKQPNQLPFPQDWQELCFKDVSFAYDEKQILKKLNLTIHRGEKIGIVGISGAGKSTFIKLVLDLYEDYQGEISYDTTSLKKIQREDYINHISTVSQDTELFNDTLKENIILGALNLKHDLTDYELKMACDVANLEDVIAKLPKKLDTKIGEKGFKLSGGERQRVGIARAIIRKPQIVVLDEATSHLDSDSEQKIQQALEDLFKDVTAIVIAHRLSTLIKMDRIIVLENGEIVEEGTITSLLANPNGKFTFFWKKQHQGF